MKGIRAWNWELYPGAECGVCERLGGLHELSAARRWLEQFKSSAMTMLTLRDQVSLASGGSWLLDRLTDDSVIEQAARLLSGGSWHVHVAGPDVGRVAAGGPQGSRDTAAIDASATALAANVSQGHLLSTAATSRKAAVTSTWIEIGLLDDDDQPVAGEAYEIKFPDGSIAKGTLSAKGNARFTGIVPGSCEVKFPNLEGSEWKRI